MDVRCWKRIMLQWITESGLTERNYYNLEQSDVDAFYQNFCRHHKVAGNASSRNSLITFLKEYYPDFYPNLDDENALSSADYIYVYSLLLHFSCVKHPESFFHETCQKLSEQAQQYIATFFKALIECSSITKEHLRHAIADVAATHLSPQHDSFNSSCSGIAAPALARIESRTDSPIKTPKRPTSTAHRISPSTPKTFLLEERTRELYNLRAQLETERYEKGLLEVQIKQNEDKILKLNHDHKKLQQQIQDLKNDILAKNTENHSPHREGDEQIKRRLCKEISQKEQEIGKLTDILSSLREEKNLVQEKLNFSEKQILVCMDRIKELDYKVDDLTQELEHRNTTIKYLTDNKLELEHFISEIRSASNSSRGDMNSSIECLDASYSRPTNSSGSASSPENLGCSVIDVQLREKESENYHLREELNTLRQSNTRLAKNIQQLTLKHSREFHILIENITVNDEEFVDPMEHFLIFANCIDKLTKFYRDEKNNVRKLNEDAYEMQERNAELCKKLLDLEEEICTLKDRIKISESKDEDLARGKIELQEKLMRYEGEIETTKRQKFDLVAKLETLASEYDAFKVECEAKERSFEDEIEALRKEKAEVNQTNSHLQVEADALQKKLESLQDEFVNESTLHELELGKLRESILQQEEELKSRESGEIKVKAKYEELLIQWEDMKTVMRDTDNHLEAMRNELARKELEMSKIGNEIIEVCTKNVELEDRIDKLMNEYKHDKHTSDMAINKREERIKAIDTEKDQLQKRLKFAEEKIEKLKFESRRPKDDLKTIFSKLEIMAKLLEVPIRENDWVNTLNDMLKKLRDVLKYNTDAASKYENLVFDNLENTAQMHMVESKLQKTIQEKEELAKKYEKTVNEVKVQLQTSQRKINDYEDRIEQLRDEQTQFINKMEQSLEVKEKERVLIEGEVTAQFEKLMQSLRDELKAEKEHHLSKERELLVVISEHNDVKKRLQETEEQLDNLQQEHRQLQITYAQKLQDIDMKMDELNSENTQLVDDINKFKQEHNTAACRLKDADSALNHLSDQLSEENANKSKLNLKLKASEMALIETEMKLESILREKSNTINDLQSNVETQSEKLKRLEDQVLVMEKLKNEQGETIAEVKQQLHKVNEERERLEKASHEFSTQIQHEQKEKAVLLRSLEKTADQLKIAVDEKSKQTSALEKRCKEMQSRLEEVTGQLVLLQNDLVAKQNELRLTLDEQQQEREEYQNKLSELMRKLSSQSERLESNEIALIEIMATLESHIHITNDIENSEIRNIFSAEDKDFDSNFNQLKRGLNRLFYNMSQIHMQIENAEQKRDEAADYVDVLTKANGKLNNQITRHKAEIAELQDMLACEARSLESKLANEVKRLNDDIQNLENVNEKLANENVSMQLRLDTLDEEAARLKNSISILNEEKNRLAEEHKSNHEQIDKMRHEQNNLNESLKDKTHALEKLQKEHTTLEKLLKERTEKLKNLEHEMKTANEKASKIQTKSHQLQQQLNTTQKELKEMQDKYRLQKTSNETLETELTHKVKQFMALQTKVDDLITVRKNLEEQFKTTSQQLEASMNAKIASENRYEQLNSQLQQVQRDYDLCKLQLQTTTSDVERLSNETEMEKNAKQQLNAEIKEVKRELQRANDNVTELIQQIASIRLEKESILDDNQLLRRQLEETGKYQTTSETKLKAIVERSQSLEQKLLAAENDLKSIRSNLSKSEDNKEKLLAENKKLRDSHDATTKRIEKLALKLGESQARCARFERENEKLVKSVDVHTVSFETLQRENSVLQNDSKILKERLAKAERTQETLTMKVQTLEKANAALEEAKQKLEASELDGKSKLIKLEKMREANEEKIRKLNQVLNNTEHANVRLNLEIGALNSQLQETKQAASAERLGQVEEITKSLKEARDQAQGFEKLSKELEVEAEKLREENFDISDKLSKVSLSLQISKQKCETLASEIEQLRKDMLNIKEEKAQIEKEHQATCRKIKEFETLNEKLVASKRDLVATSEAKVRELEAELKARITEINTLNKEVQMLRSMAQQKSTALEECTAATAEMDTLRTRLNVAEAMIEKEQKLTAQLRVDNQNLLAKYREAKQTALEESKASEERIKQNRLDLEGKLEKMKNKMDGAPHSLDDSMSALLSTTTCGTRKKINGAPLYKRPGPPTPSKNGGRLSFGGNSEPPREILKETHDNVSSSKTPARFGFFSSRFSLGNTKDEPNCPPIELRKAIATRNLKMAGHDCNGVCTSTPRKSQTHFDLQRRLIDDLNGTSPSSSSPCSLERKPTITQITPPDVSVIGTPTSTQPRLKTHAPQLTQMHSKLINRQQALFKRRRSCLLKRRMSRQLNDLIATPSSHETTSSAKANSPHCKALPRTALPCAGDGDGVPVAAEGIVTTSSSCRTKILQRRLRRRTRRERNARPSLYLCGNIFAKYRTPTRATVIEVHHNKVRKQRRNDNYNQFRVLDSTKVEPSSNETYDLSNNNYASFNHNGHSKTVVLVKNEVLTEGEEQTDDLTSADIEVDVFEVDNEYEFGDDDDYEDYLLVESNDEMDSYENKDDVQNISYNLDAAGNVQNIKTELITSHELAAFDMLSAKYAPQQFAAVDCDAEVGNAKHFENILRHTESQAPFVVQRLDLNSTYPFSTTTANTHTHSSHSDGLPNNYSNSALSACSTAISEATPHRTPPTGKSHSSRTIYGGSVIVNRRIPNVNTTFVRKSSIYIKSENANVQDDIILVANQTVTLADLVHMWKQMDSAAHVIVGFAILASITTLIGLFLVFCKR